MKISYNWLKEYLPRLPKPEKLAELLTTHSFEVKNLEEIRNPKHEIRNDYILDIDILPNRAHDCLSYIGVARECSALLNSKSEARNPKLIEDKKIKIQDFLTVNVQDKEECPRYTARAITNIKIGPSPKWLREKLESIEQKSINNIVDATNYVMFETGQPLHAFDFDKISGAKSQIPSSKSKTVFIRKAKKGEKIITLDNEEYKLTDELVIADSKGPLALAGIKGGKKAEITNKTKTIVLESANFNYALIRNASRKMGLRTDASMRFEYGLDPNLTTTAIDRVAALIKEIAGGKIARGIVDVYPKKVYPLKISLDPKKAEEIIGAEISKPEAIRKLKLLGFAVDNALRVTVPTIRQDIKIQEDLIEEIVRLIGYDQIKPKAPLGFIGITKTDNVTIITNKVKTIIEGAGFSEVYNFSFVGEDDLNKLKLPQNQYLELENPLSDDLKYLRRDLIINILKNIEDNYKQIFSSDDTIKIFEMGKTYFNESNKIKEQRMFTGAIVRQIEKIKGENFYELKGVLDNLFVKLGISDYWYDNFKATPEYTAREFWADTATAEIKINDREIGFVGEINPRVLDRFKIKRRVAMFNLNFDLLLQLVSEELIYQLPSPYPAAIRDLAVLVSSGDRVGDVMKIIDDAGGELVQDVDLFDMYEGPGIPANKKNLAFHIIFQSYEKTLTDEEVDKIFRKIISSLEKNNNWKVRK
jgi:phenylalanyl-tRNA synthetase beta chain